jgi:hypothetical protein
MQSSSHKSVDAFLRCLSNVKYSTRIMNLKLSLIVVIPAICAFLIFGGPPMAPLVIWAREDYV